MTVPEVGPYDRSGPRYDFVASPASASRAFLSSGATGLLTVRSGPSGAQPAVVAADRAKRDVLTLAALGEPIGAPNRFWIPALPAQYARPDQRAERGRDQYAEDVPGAEERRRELRAVEGVDECPGAAGEQARGRPRQT